MKESRVQFLTQAAMIAAVYVVLTFVFQPIGFMGFQVRIAEMLTILPFFTPAAIPGLFVGCLLGNILGGAILLDVIVGSLTTLVAACISYKLRNNKYLVALPPIILNALIIPWILKYGYQQPLSIPVMMGTVGIGEILSCGVLGISFASILSRYKKQIFRYKVE